MPSVPGNVVCGYLADGSQLFQLLCEKLESAFDIRAVTSSNLQQMLCQCDVLLVPVIPDSGNQRRVELSMIERMSSSLPVVAVLPAISSGYTKDAMEAGAFACWSESDSIEDLQGIIRRASQFRQLQQALEQLSASGGSGPNRLPVIGGAKIASLVSLAARLARSDVNVLITGESGTGKEVFARILHESGPRANAPFIAVACASLPETLIESELFGHERGAFTGAVSARRGRFEEVGAGTLFLDEIAELSPAMQVKLLRVLQERTFERLGSARPIRCHARIVFATHRSLTELTAAGKFRLDLYYRLAGAQLHLPALRERPEDVRLLAEYFIATAAARQRRPIPRLTDAAVEMMKQHDWPGNVRELQNIMEVIVALTDEKVIEPCHLATHISVPPAQRTELIDGSFEEEVRAFKRRLIERKLIEHHNNKLQAAKSLGLARSSLHRLIDELHIEAVRMRPSKPFPFDS